MTMPQVCVHVHFVGGGVDVFNTISSDLMFHWLRLYTKGFYTICTRCVECVPICLCVCSCVMCEFLQGRCSRHVTCMGVRHHGGSDIAEWVNTKYRLIRFSLTQPVCTSTFSNLFTSSSSTIIMQCLLVASCCSDDCTVHNLFIKSVCDLIYESNNSLILGFPGCTDHIFVVWG